MQLNPSKLVAIGMAMLGVTVLGYTGAVSGDQAIQVYLVTLGFVFGNMSKNPVVSRTK